MAGISIPLGKMAVGVAVYIAIGLLVWALASLFNSPVPKGYKDPWKLRAIFAMMKLMRIKVIKANIDQGWQN